MRRHPHPYVLDTTDKVDALMGQKDFIDACDTAGTPVTRRQARKFLQRRGLAYSNRG